MRRFWKRDQGLAELERRLRARRSSAPPTFVRMLAARAGGETRGLRPRARVVFAVGIVVIALVAVASAGGFSAATSATGGIVGAVADLTSSSSPSSSPQSTVDNSPAASQYPKPGKGCGDPNHLHERRFECKASLNSVANKEGNSGLTPFAFTISLDGTPLSTVQIAWTTADGSATLANNDYLPGAGTATFLPGITAQTATVYVVGDTVPEPNETFYVNITVVSDGNAYIGNGTGTGTIVNDDK